jgi:hypothetical protein
VVRSYRSCVNYRVQDKNEPRKSHTGPFNIEGATDDCTQTAFLLVAQFILELRVTQGACPVRPVEEQARGDDTTADLSFYSRADYNSVTGRSGSRRENVWHPLVRPIVPHLVVSLEKFEYRSNGGRWLVWV